MQDLTGAKFLQIAEKGDNGKKRGDPPSMNFRGLNPCVREAVLASLSAEGEQSGREVQVGS